MSTFRPIHLCIGFSLAVSTSIAADESPSGLKALDLEGGIHELGGRSGTTPFALVFLGTECPISRKAIPELNRISKEAAQAGVDLLGVVSEPRTTRAKALEHAKEFGAVFPVLFDGTLDLAQRLGPTHVPEAFLFGRDGKLAYRGAIDDAFADVSKERANVKSHYLADAVRAAAAGRAPEAARTQPVGCIFEATAKSGAGPVTYTRHIAPLLNLHCVGCHREGEIAPFTLLSYADAAKRAKQISSVTHKRVMPPWVPSEGYGAFLDETRLTDSEIALIGAWAEAGAPEGDPADLPPQRKFSSGWKLGEPDLVLKMPEPFAVGAEGRDSFRCFVLPTELTEDKIVVGVEYRPGAPTVVHHALFFLDNSGAARKLDEKDSGPGYEQFGGIGFLPSGGLGGYAPGALPRLMPDGTGRQLQKGSDVVLQVHYHASGKAEKDQGSIAIYFAKKPVEKIISGTVLVNRQIDIAPGDSHYAREATMTLPVDVTVIGVAPHMHYLGREMKIHATKPSGEDVPLIWVKDWDFRWQGQYLFRDPIRLPKGTRIDLNAVYDNSASNIRNPSDPPKRVRNGEQTTDEMCMAFLQIITDSPEDRQKVRRAMLWNLFQATQRDD